MKINNRKIITLSAFALMGLQVPLVQAAIVPSGVTLASKQELVRSNGAEPATLDPQLAESNESFNIILDCFSGLVSIDAAGKIHPDLAAKWENQNNTVWTFHLRPGIVWSNGKPITAQDVVFSWQRLVDPKTASPYASFASNAHIENAQAIADGKMPVSQLGVKALDDHTVQVTLSQPVSYFLQFVGHISLFPVNKAVVEQFGDKWTQPGNIVTSGAYTPVQWVVNEKVVAQRNPKYWDNKATVINKVTYLPIADQAAMVNRYRAGEIDITDTIPTIQYRQLKTELGGQVHNTDLLGIYYYKFNTVKAPFNDVRVRQALNLALNKSIITDKVVGQGQKPADTLMPLKIGGMTFTPPAYAAWSQSKRNAEAKKLLAEAGFTPAHPLKLNLLYNTSQDHQRIAIAATSMWKKNLGADVTMKNQEWKTMLDTMRQGNFDLVRYTWLADYNEPSTFFNTFRTGDTQNTTKYSNSHFDAAIQTASETTDAGKIKQEYQTASDILSNDVPAIPVYYYVQNQLVKPFIGGFTVSPLGFYLTRNIYIKQH
ncbi:oligopeptide ABC transporter substrate-binding protein OppA [Prodigiosinella confusarubida]|uniref:Oligopeptide ABC transporter substrate-binding protein OppA n=1 Tax=Serratia sp. (strain ATCC 39006) TaxID=104623 RepID=A0A2I5T636_SERS3|nr:ABC transporter substrate-binding protein [Serratia sp. ATCC 39006]AUG99991.1 oligopeptide ABC transporter substrate-binding protein OppA [Serratia sp. ATCC 39006]AUH04311.1 oligopeptide ABC transporter substrate-binding protein OppA [Serratia sp. ATCC 39006]